MKCQRCGEREAVRVVRESGRNPAQAQLCSRCAVLWEKRKALIKILGPAGAAAFSR